MSCKRDKSHFSVMYLSPLTLGVIPGLPFGESFFKVICYLYSTVDCFHIW